MVAVADGAAVRGAGSGEPPFASVTGGLRETPEPVVGSAGAFADATLGTQSASVASATTSPLDIGTPRRVVVRAGGVPAAGCASVAAVLTITQSERLAACARVLDAPARIVMTGDVSPAARAAMTSGAGPGVEVLIVDPGEIKRVDGSIDVLFVGPTARYGVALDMLRRWPGRVVPGGVLFVHGAFAAPALTAALLRTIGSSRAWRYFGRDGALAEYVQADLSHGERVLDAIAQAAQMPSFARSLARGRDADVRTS